MERSPFVVALVAVEAASVGCATTHAGNLARGGPPRPVPKITNDEEFADARSDYTILAPGRADRTAWRAALVAYLMARGQDLLAKRSDDAVEAFRNACSLYEPEELARPDVPESMERMAERIAEVYAMRGAEEPVVLALSVQASRGKTAEKRWNERLRWIDEFEASTADGAARHGVKIIDALEKTVHVWPSPIVVDRLAALYLEQHEALVRALRRGAQGGATDLVEGQGAGATRTAYKLAALYLRIGRPDRATAALSKIAEQPGDDPILRGLLARAQHAKKASDPVELAKYFIREDVADREVAMRVCLAAADQFPQSAEIRFCAAEMAAYTMRARMPLAIELLEEGIALAPKERPPVELLVRLKFEWLREHMGEERTRVDAALPEAEKLARFIQAKQVELGGKPLEPDVADLWFEIAQGYYNAGAPAEAEQNLRRSLEQRPSWKANHQLGLLRLKHGQFEEAVRAFDRALALPTRSLPEAIEVRATVLRDKGEALERDGKTAAKGVRQTALEAWEQELALAQSPGEEARIQIERGRLCYELGRRREAIDAFEKAIDRAPQRAESYADVVAFLVPRGHLREALDAYHRALGRPDIGEYMKVYASLWVIDLAARQKEPPDPLAEQFLRSVDSNRWYAELARWASGRQSWQQLIDKADTPGHQAEAFFYQAQRLLLAGQETEAKSLWKRVLATHMMGFFEFEMADYYLRKGVPHKAPAIPPAERLEKKPAGETI
jgi:tetratricopeptide (TPR) repeat protein